MDLIELTPEEKALAVQIGRLFSEWTNDHAPIGENLYRMAAESFLRRFTVTPKPLTDDHKDHEDAI